MVDEVAGNDDARVTSGNLAYQSPVSASVSRRMANTRRRDTTSEMALRRAVFALGLRYRVDARPVPCIRRHADLVFPGAKVAVFLDGCFWHGCPEHVSWPRRNAAYWRNKIEANRRRDEQTNMLLRAAGWTVIRVWEHENPVQAAAHVAAVVRPLIRNR